MSTFYFFYQLVPEGPWELQLASERAKIEQTMKPAFVTVLDLDTSFSQGNAPQGDEVFKVRYRGPFYADFDSLSLEEVIPQFKRFLLKLVDLDVSLDQCRLYATGGKGFHIEVPYRCFVDKKTHADVAMLPLIYKEVAQELFVDTLDLRVYSARRGRMWRTEGVQRTNGMYKVRISPEEARNMTPDLYRELCASPRHLPDPAEPTIAAGFALTYHQCKERYEGGASKRKASVKANAEIKARYGNTWPPLVRKLMSGEGIKPDAGFQRIATQLAITAQALDMPEKDLLEACEALCVNHVGDGNRYNTPEKRRREVSRMYWYLAENPTYSYSAGAVKALLAQPEEEDQAESAEADPLDFAVTRGFRVTAQGMFTPKDGDEIRVSSLGMDNPTRLIDLRENITTGYDVELYIGGRSLGAHMLHMERLSSKVSFQRWTMEKASASVQATDNQVAAIADILRIKSMKENRAMYIVSREGLDVIQLPIKEGSAPETDIVWVAKDQVLSRNGNHYRWRNETNDNGYGCDIHHAPRMEDTPETRKFMSSLFQMNSPTNIAYLLGWHSAAMINAWIRRITKEFPTLHPWGEAGAGKTKTLEIFGHLFYFHRTPKIIQASATTNFSFIGFVTGSASVPLVIDEYKPRDMRSDASRFIRTGLINSNYTGHEINRGSVGNDAGARGTRINGFENSAPLVVIGEFQETTSSVVDRTVVVPLTIHYRVKNPQARPSYEFCFEHRHLMSGMGRVMLDYALYQLEEQELKDTLSQSRKILTDEVIKTHGSVEGYERPIANLTTVLTGLNLFKACLRQVFGPLFDEEMNRLKDAVVYSTSGTVTKGSKRSEASKVMNTLARMSYFTDDDTTRLIEGQDYSVAEEYVDVSMRNCFAKYTRYCRVYGQEVLYDNEDAFISAMRRYSGLRDEAADNDQLRPNPMVEVFRFSNAYLDKEGVEYFKGR